MKNTSNDKALARTLMELKKDGKLEEIKNSMISIKKTYESKSTKTKKGKKRFSCYE